MRKILLSVLILLFFINPSTSAQTLGKTMLWKISGNGLSKPSYLYGTMHVADPRLFVLGDSLLQAISITEGFANELDLNQITPMITEMVQDKLTHAVSVKKLLSKKKFDQYAPGLAKKFNKPAEDITSMDILKEKNKWIDESMKGKKMQTFLDAYLTDLANRQGKWIGGIEDFSDQSGLINSIVDESDIEQLAISDSGTGDPMTEQMTHLYLEGDVEGFQTLINGMDSNYRDQLLIKRNHKMAYRMDSLARVRTTVFAVGAAHLPGTEGLIRLLRSRGFSVDPVFSSRKIKPEDYHVKEVARPWVEVKDADGRYRALMPGTPGNVRLYGMLTIQMYYNIFNGTMYMTFCMPAPYAASGMDSVEKLMVEKMFGGADFSENRKLMVANVPGKSFSKKNAEGYKKIYLFNKDHFIYVAMGFANSDAAISMEALEKFFSSYQPIVKAVNTQFKDYHYTDSANFYSVSFPAEPLFPEKPTEQDKSVSVVLKMSIDPDAGTYYFCGANNCRRGYVFRNDSIVAKNTRDNMIGKYDKITLDTIYTEGNRRVIELQGTIMNGAMMGKAKIIFRGNRYYTVTAAYQSAESNDLIDKRIHSLQIVPYSPGYWSRQTAPDSLFSAWAPDKVVYTNGKDTSQTLDYLHYEIYDSTRLHTYVMQMDTVEKYFWRENDTALWKYVKEKYTRAEDTVLSEQMYTRDGLSQFEFTHKARGANNVMRTHVWLRGDTLYRLFCLQEPETILDSSTTRLFREIHFNYPAKQTHVFDSKASAIFSDLQSADTLISRAANQALEDARFSAADIPLMQQAVLRAYPPDDALTNSTNGSIAEKIISLNDSVSVAFARDHFVTAKDEQEKNGLMDLISARHTTANYDSLGHLLIAAAPAHQVPKWVTKKWKDSLQVSAHLFPAVLPLLGDSMAGSSIYVLADPLLDDSLISFSIFKPWQSTILRYASKRYHATVKDTLYYMPADYSVIYLLQRFNNDSCNAMLKQWLNVAGNEMHKKEIVWALLKNGQTLPAYLIMDQAADKRTRLPLYRNLKDNKKTGLFPSKYLTQSYFAESLVGEAVRDYTDQEVSSRFLKVKEMKWHGKISRFFFYDIYLTDDDKHLLVFAGPFNKDKISVSFYDAQSFIYQQYYDAEKSEQQMLDAVEKVEVK